MLKLIRYLLLFCLVSGSAAAASVDDIVFMTEQYPPYNLEQDIKKHKIGTIRDDIAEQFLVNAGISMDSMDRVADSVLNIKKLNRGRIDLWAYGEDVAMWELKANGFNPADYESVHVLNRKDLYFAFNKDTPDAVTQKLQAALDTLRADGEYEKILDRFLR